jgi:ribulose-phosphate 3-epimerase
MAFQPLIAPSILSADFSRLADQVAAAEEAGGDWLHLDVMDGHFVPEISFGSLMVETCRSLTKLPLNVHLMIEKPERHLERFASAGADHIIVHVETCPHLHRTLQHIQELGCKAGVALNPATPAALVEPALDLADIVLVMSVNPGYSSQSFIPQVLPKVAQIRKWIEKMDREIRIEMDGGIDAATLPLALAAGADTFVAATAIFKHKDGIAAGLAALRSASLHSQTS